MGNEEILITTLYDDPLEDMTFTKEETSKMVSDARKEIKEKYLQELTQDEIESGQDSIIDELLNPPQDTPQDKFYRVSNRVKRECRRNNLQFNKDIYTCYKTLPPCSKARIIKSDRLLNDSYTYMLLKDFITSNLDTTTSSILLEEEIDRTNGLKIIIYSNDHAPAHFHVEYNNINNSYRIDNFTLYARKAGTLTSKQEKIVKKWYDNQGKADLEEAWKRIHPVNF